MQPNKKSGNSYDGQVAPGNVGNRAHGDALPFDKERVREFVLVVRFSGSVYGLRDCKHQQSTIWEESKGTLVECNYFLISQLA